MNEALNVTSLASSDGPSRRSMSRIASDTRLAASNMVRTFHSDAGLSGSSPRCLSRLMMACVPARLPELRSTSTRSPVRSNSVILQNFATLSRPAFVLESDAKIMPSSSLMPTQYVTVAASRRAAVDGEAAPETGMPSMIACSSPPRQPEMALTAGKSTPVALTQGWRVRRCRRQREHGGRTGLAGCTSKAQRVKPMRPASA